MFLRKFVLHAGDGCAEEEGDEVLVGAIGADLLEGGDVGGAVFKADDEQGMPSAKQDEVGEQAARTAIAVAEGVQVFEETMKAGCHDHGMDVTLQRFGC